MYCPECGRENSDQARFCAACGSPLAAPDAADAGMVREAPPQDAPSASQSTSQDAGTSAAPTAQPAAPMRKPKGAGLPGRADEQSANPKRKSRAPMPLVAVAGVLAGLLVVSLILLLAPGGSNTATVEVVVSEGQDAQSGEGSKDSDEKQSDSSASEDDASQKAAAPKHKLSYSWSSAVPEGMEVEIGSASADVWYPVFAGEGDDAAIADAINADAREQVQTAYDSLASWKSWASVYLYPEVTLRTNDYIAIHYYHCYNAGTSGTIDFAGEGALYDLSDGGKKVSPAVLAGIGEDELLSRAASAASESGVSARVVYDDVSQMLAEGQAGYVILSDGIYLYLRGADATDRSTLAFYLVGVCEPDGSDGTVRGKLVDLSAEQTFNRYRDLDRSGTTTLDEATGQQEKQASKSDEDDQEVIGAVAPSEDDGQSYPIQTATTYETQDFKVTFPSSLEGSWSVTTSDTQDGGTSYTFESGPNWSTVSVHDSEQQVITSGRMHREYRGHSSRGKYVYLARPAVGCLFHDESGIEVELT